MGETVRMMALIDDIYDAANWRLCGARHMDACCLYQIFKDTAFAGAWNPFHGIRQVPVKSRKKAEAVFAGQVLAPALAALGDGNASRFAPKNIATFANGHCEAALDEFVCRTQPAHASSENDRVLRHAPVLYP